MDLIKNHVAIERKNKDSFEWKEVAWICDKVSAERFAAALNEKFPDMKYRIKED